MKESNKLALIVAYYLSRFDERAYLELGFQNQRLAHESIGNRLGVKPNSVKNMRDEFDPLHENKRVGWYQRELRPSRRLIVEAFRDFSEYEMKEFVRKILETDTENNKMVGLGISAALDLSPSTSKRLSSRGLTGRNAEDFFIQHNKTWQEPSRGQLIDTRNLGCGYDFEIVGDQGTVFIEVKGLAESRGNILFTSKEWEVANLKSGSYYLAMVVDLATEPKVYFVQNPFLKLKASPSLIRTVQTQWTVSGSQLADLLNLNK